MESNSEEDEAAKEAFKEKIRSIGISKQRPFKRVPVIADEGRFRGQEVGHHIHHADGRVDATSTKQDITPFVKVVRKEN